MTEATNTTILDLDALMDSTLDGVKDIPDFCNPPTGNYVLSIPKAEIKPGKPAAGDKAAQPAIIQLTYKVEATVQTESTPVADGTQFTERFQGTQQGLEYFKKQAKKLLNAESVDGISLRDLLNGLTEIGTFDAAIKTATTKNKDGREYENVNVRPVYESVTA